MGKATKYRDTAPKRARRDGPHATLVEQIKATLPADQPSVLGREYCQFRAQKEALEEQIKKLNAEIEARSDLLVEWMETSGVDKVGIQEADRTLYIKDSIYSTAEDKEAFHAWIKENGLADALFSVHYMTLNSLVMSRLENGENVPPGVRYYNDAKITWR